MADRRHFGVETEYPLYFFDRHGTRLGEQTALERVFDAARQSIPHIADVASGGLFLQNGSRFYPDSGKAEFATPETTSYWDTCRYVKAGELILEQIRSTLEQQSSIGHGQITRSNVCYGPNPTTWARHLSVGHQVSPDKLPDQLIPHLVSQVIYTGAGGFNNRSAGIEFMISPRVAHLEAAISPESTSGRGIFHTKNESHCRGWHRLHVLTGESLCSETSTGLSIAMTVLCVALIESGSEPGNAVRLKDPLAAMKRFATDVSLTETALDVDNKNWTALDIQRHYLTEIESRLDHAAMPSWGATACAMCREVLDRLEQGPHAVSRELDWAIKFPIYTRWIEKWGFTSESIGQWNQVVNRLVRVVNDNNSSRKRVRLTPDDLPLSKATLAQAAFLSTGRGLPAFDCADLEWFLQLQQELFEMDARHGELSDCGIFNQLDHDGVLDHHVEQVENISSATTEPPAAGRAHLRGELIRRVQADRHEYAGNWSYVVHLAKDRKLVFFNETATTEIWHDIPKSEFDEYSAHRLRREMRSDRSEVTAYERAERCYDCGDLEQGYQIIRPLVADDNEDIGDLGRRLYAWIQARRGFLDGVEKLDAISRRQRQPSQSLITDYLLVYRFGGGLQPCDEMEEWIQLEEQLTPSPQHRSPARREHRAAWLLYRNRLEESRELLKSILETPEQVDSGHRFTGRGLAALSETYRRLGETSSAMQKADEAYRALSDSGRLGDLADFALIQRAKLATEPSIAMDCLDEALSIQTNFGNMIGETRTLLLQARISESRDASEVTRTRVQSLQERHPALQRCRLLGEILTHWNEWIDGDDSPSGINDRFWGL